MNFCHTIAKTTENLSQKCGLARLKAVYSSESMCVVMQWARGPRPNTRPRIVNTDTHTRTQTHTHEAATPTVAHTYTSVDIDSVQSLKLTTTQYIARAKNRIQPDA